MKTSVVNILDTHTSSTHTHFNLQYTHIFDSRFILSLSALQKHPSVTFFNCVLSRRTNQGQDSEYRRHAHRPHFFFYCILSRSTNNGQCIRSRLRAPRPHLFFIIVCSLDAQIKVTVVNIVATRASPPFVSPLQTNSFVKLAFFYLDTEIKTNVVNVVETRIGLDTFQQHLAMLGFFFFVCVKICLYVCVCNEWVFM